MDKTFSKNIFWVFPCCFLIAAFLYIFFVVEPILIFHHVQPGFIQSPVFYKQFLNYPGGLAELAGNFIMQSFYFNFFGSAVILLIVCSITWFMYLLINSIYKSKNNLIWAIIPSLLSIVLINNYNFPFSTIVSIAFLLLLLAILSKLSKGFISAISLFSFGAVSVYYFAGSGYMGLFSFAAIFINASFKNWLKATYIFFVIAFAIFFPILASKYLFAVSFNHRFFYFFSTKAWFMKYYPSVIFSIYIISIPVILFGSNIVSLLRNLKVIRNLNQKPGFVSIALALLATIFIAVFSHNSTFNSDAKKIIKSDYYCYNNDVEKTKINSTTTKEYSFAANVNYNLVLSKTKRVTQDFFSFMQIKGAESLHPDIDFATELSFISSDFYYELGFISEARHWAYEALVFYPYSLRAMQNLVKIHLATGEYKAAERTLNTLNKGLIDKKFVREYVPYVLDTTLFSTNDELMEKRSFISVDKELNRSIEGRLIELLEANNKNKLAFEYLMLYYLSKAQLDKFVSKINEAHNYFEKMPKIYEEALLMHSQSTKNPLPENIRISSETKKRFQNFINELEKYKGKTRLARNELYAEYGNTYLYFLKFVYPNVMETETISDEEDYPEI